MKATGLIRRIDDLGRIQIPKVIRNQMFGLEEWNSWGVPFEFLLMEIVL